VDRVEALHALVRLSRLLERASGELSLAHYRVLAAVADGDERASHVAARLALGKPAISASVDALCRRQLLVREQSADDQRVVALRLTQAGRAVLADTESAMLARLDSVLRHADEPGHVVAAMAGLGAALDRLSAERLTNGRA
jgi:DNA-binding MarR family transcriptional regulator